MRKNDAVIWLVLDNLKNNWPVTTNIGRKQADDGLKKCEQQGLTKDGQLTDKGRCFSFLVR